jgi:hypothetical protein
MRAAQDDLEPDAAPSAGVERCAGRQGAGGMGKRYLRVLKQKVVYRAPGCENEACRRGHLAPIRLASAMPLTNIVIFWSRKAREREDSIRGRQALTTESSARRKDLASSMCLSIEASDTPDEPGRELRIEFRPSMPAATWPMNLSVSCGSRAQSTGPEALPNAPTQTAARAANTSTAAPTTSTFLLI